jgi:DNA polymerase-3 subunit delta'
MVARATPIGNHCGMSLRPLYGHSALRARLAASLHGERLPASLLLQGNRGVGKQRLGLWLGQLLLCETASASKSVEPCGDCVHCRYVIRGQHPDLHWFFPRPRLKDGDASPDEVKADLAEAIADRVQADGLWSPSVGTEALYVATVRALVAQASMRPAMARRSVFIVGDAERMVAQEGSDQAANAFLKLLEEPPPGATIILTSSEPGALLPTIRSRVVTIRVAPLPTHDMTSFLADSAVQRKFAGSIEADLLSRAAGAPGELFASEGNAAAVANARKILEVALRPGSPDATAERIKVAARQGVAGARGAFTDTLEALTMLLHERVRRTALAGHVADARRSAQAIVAVEQVRLRAQGNVSPQLLGGALVEDLHRVMRP